MQFNHVIKKISKWKKYAFSKNLFEYYDLGAETKEHILSRNLPKNDPDEFIPSKILSTDGIELNIEKQIERLKNWKNNYLDYYKVLRTDNKINTQCLGKDYLHNGFYPTPEAEIYASMILDYKPSRIVEVGSGYSTLIARNIVKSAGMNTTIDVIDPKPRTDVRNEADTVYLKHIEDIDNSELNITENTLFFIDSSHICRGFGDVPYLFCQIIPRLPAGVLVHVHDVFIPFDYPITYLKRLYTEQYVLSSLLSHTNRYKIIFTTHYLSRKYPDAMQATFGSIVGSDNRFFGSSFWFCVDLM